MSYLKDGQYRYVKYSDDGCSIYQCMWCHNTIEIRDNPEWSKWNFCPKCGKSWFNRRLCRDHNTPRWAWDKHGDFIPPDVTVHKYTDIQTHNWIIEERTKFLQNQKYSDWKFRDYIIIRNGELGHWRKVLVKLKQLRSNTVSDSYVKFEYRARLEKI